jgi:hypothetical protein
LLSAGADEQAAAKMPNAIAPPNINRLNIIRSNR